MRACRLAWTSNASTLPVGPTALQSHKKSFPFPHVASTTVSPGCTISARRECAARVTRAPCLKNLRRALPSSSCKQELLIRRYLTSCKLVKKLRPACRICMLPTSRAPALPMKRVLDLYCLSASALLHLGGARTVPLSGMVSVTPGSGVLDLLCLCQMLMSGFLQALWTRSEPAAQTFGSSACILQSGHAGLMDMPLVFRNCNALECHIHDQYDQLYQQQVKR